MSGRRSSALRLLVAAALVPAAATAAEESCGLCHPESRVEFSRGIHAREGVGCTSCHGGDPRTRDADRAHGRGFRALDERRLVPALCAECHADLEQMRPYNLPIDQYALYLTSRHGEALAEGDSRTAVCTDCHGVHDIAKPSDPASPAHPRRVAETCGRCHGDDALMERYGLDATVVEKFRASVHGEALLRRGVAAAPDCTSCHGVHGSTPPGYGDVDKICGACHSDTRAAFVAGPHHDAMRDAGLAECASCHENHAIRRFTDREIQELCAECHGDGSDEVALGARIQTLMGGAADELEGAEELVRQAEGAAFDIEDHLGRLEEARTYLTEAQPLTHTVMLAPVEQVTRRARSIGEEVRHELYAKLDRTLAHVGLALFWFYLVMTLAVLFGFKRRLARGGR